MSNYTKKPMNPNNFIVFDFETGGLDSRKNPVTEIALISLDGKDLKKINDYQSLIGPYDDKLIYEQKALDYTGITMDMLNDEGKGIVEVAKEVFEKLKEANNRQEKSPGLKPVLVGHNVQFDIGMLHHLMEWGFKDTGISANQKLSEVLHGTTDHYGNFHPTYLDTWLFGKLWFQGEGEMTNYKLGTLVDKLGIDINNAHRAMNDVVSTAEVLRVGITTLRNGFTQNYQGGREGFYFPI